MTASQKGEASTRPNKKAPTEAKRAPHEQGLGGGAKEARPGWGQIRRVNSPNTTSGSMFRCLPAEKSTASEGPNTEPNVRLLRATGGSARLPRNSTDGAPCSGRKSWLWASAAQKMAAQAAPTPPRPTLDGTHALGVSGLRTWAVMLIGFAGLGYVGYRRAREQRAA